MLEGLKTYFFSLDQDSRVKAVVVSVGPSQCIVVNI